MQQTRMHVLLSKKAAINFWGLSSSTYEQIDTTASSYTGGRDNCQQPTISFYIQYLTPRIDWIWVHYLGVKRMESEAEQSPQSSVEVKHTWRFNSSLHCILIAVRLSKQKTSALHLKKNFPQRIPSVSETKHADTTFALHVILWTLCKLMIIR